jgi:exodeoxyribonuclease VII small subunit
MKDSNFEDKIEKAKEILEKLMNPEITLSDSITYYKEGMDELKNASKLLQEAELEFKEHHEEKL